MSKEKLKSLKSTDLIGSWTILSIDDPDEAGRKRWHCKCVCGTERTINDYVLKKGRSTSCGRGQCNYLFKDLSGIKFGRWLVKGLSEKRKRARGVTWNVECDCGKVGIVSSNSLMCGDSKSCGCLNIDTLIKRNTLPPKEAALRKLFRNYCWQAKIREYSFEFAEIEFRKLINSNCYYCDKIPSTVGKAEGGNIVYNGLDRVDNSMGYSLDNCVPCCESCNKKKMGVTIEIAIKMVEWLKQKNKGEQL
jgi:hypothetical protein